MKRKLEEDVEKNNDGEKIQNEVKIRKIIKTKTERKETKAEDKKQSQEENKESER